MTALQLDSAVIQPIAYDEELDGAEVPMDSDAAAVYGDDYGAGYDGAGYHGISASPNTLEAANQLMHMEETPAQKQAREDIEIGDLIMKGTFGGTFSEAEIERIRELSKSPGASAQIKSMAAM